MVKKAGDKGSVKEKSMSAVSQESNEEDPNRSPEPYMCNGNFQTDFVELCRRNSMDCIPAVLYRPHAPNAYGQQQNHMDAKSGKDKNKLQPEAELEVEPIETDGPDPPKTYITKDSYEYFRPSVQVELEVPEKHETLAELYVRGWKIDEPMMNTFRQCLPMCERLHTINFWNTGLNAETVDILADLVLQCLNMRTLVLDNNSVVEENFHLFINEESPIQNLSLRYCGITDIGAEHIGKSLGSPQKYNSKLLSLNLSGNKITDAGVEHIVTGLRMNRALLSLSLSQNKIGDPGAVKIAEVLSRFPLTHEEVVERRRLKSDHGSPDRNKSPSRSRAESRDRPGSVRSSTQMDKSRRDKSSKKKPEAKGKEVKEDTKGKKEKEDKNPKKTASVVVDAGKMMGKGKDQKGKKKEKGSTLLDQEPPDIPEMMHALLEPADYIDGHLWISGNRTLININLSRNQIGELGLSSLVRAMQYQTTLTLGDKSLGRTGLMRIAMHRNKVDPEHEIIKKLNELMLPKDPFYKPMKSPEEESQS